VEAQCKYIVVTGHICLDVLYVSVNVGNVMSVWSFNGKHIHWVDWQNDNTSCNLCNLTQI